MPEPREEKSCENCKGTTPTFRCSLIQQMHCVKNNFIDWQPLKEESEATKKIEKLNKSFYRFDECGIILDKINEIIEVINGKQ